MAAEAKVILLTGASRGIGLAVAHHLLKQHCKLVVTARSEAPLHQLKAEFPGQVAVVVGDMADAQTAPRAVAAATATFGGLDAVVVNHGVLDPVARLVDARLDEWKACYDVCFFSAVAVVAAAIPALRRSRGSVVLVSSGAAAAGYAAWGAYGSAKAAVNHLAMTLASEEPDITCLAIRPGTVDTDMQTAIRGKHVDVMDKEDADKFASLPGTGGLLRPDQPGNVIARLAMHAPKDLSGRFLTWNDQLLAAYQE